MIKYLRSVGLLAIRSCGLWLPNSISSLRLMAMADTISEPWLIALEYAYDSGISILQKIVSTTRSIPFFPYLCIRFPKEGVVNVFSLLLTGSKVVA